MNATYKTIDELPAVLNAKIIKEFLGISTGTVHQLLNSQGFPTLRINSRKLVPKEAFVRWMDANTGISKNERGDHQ